MNSPEKGFICHPLVAISIRYFHDADHGRTVARAAAGAAFR